MPTLVTRGAASVRGFGFAGTSPVLADPYFNYTTLLLHGNGTNGGQNNTFLDSGTANGGVGFDITRNGNTTQGTFSPFSQTGWSNYFEGSGDYLSVADATALNVSTGDFTLECWAFPTSSSTYQTIFAKGGVAGSDVQGISLSIASGTFVGLCRGSGAQAAITSSAFALSTWNHLVLVRSGTTLALFVNGIRAGTQTNSNDASNTRIVSIGTAYDTSLPFTGYVSNARIVKGTAVYDPTQTSITVPTAPLTNITNTSLLTCQSNRFIDNGTANSGSGFTLTVNGNTSVQAFSPFAPTAAYSASTVGGSGYFDGSGDNLAISSGVTDQFDPGSAFTFECWVYFAGGNDNQCFQVRGSSNDWSGSTGILFAMYSNDSGTSRWQFNGNGSAISVSGTAPPNGTWAHLAVGYNGTTTRFWINGQSVGTSTSSYTKPTYSNVAIGSNVSNNTPLNGFMSSLRFVKGADVYGVSNTSITVPTAPLTTTVSSGTVSLLCNFTNAAIIDNTAKNVLETVGNAQISTTQSKFGGASMYFDGTGDYLSAADSPNFYFGSGDWTIEAWLYINTAKNYNGYFGKRQAGQFGLTLQIDSSGTLSISASTTGSSWALAGASLGSGYSTGAWMHVAVTRSGTTITGWRNGTSTGTQTLSGSIFPAIGYIATIGSANDSSQEFNGYIDDFRITKGIARYTSNFTPQTSQWQDQ